MNAEKFFQQYSIEEISSRTKISPVSLKYIKEKQFDKIPRIKLIGFVRIIQREYGVDLDELINEYDSHTSYEPQEPVVETEEELPTKEKKPYLIMSLAILLLFILAYILFKYFSAPKQSEITPPKNNISKVQQHLIITETNNTKTKEQNKTSYSVTAAAEVNSTNETSPNISTNTTETTVSLTEENSTKNQNTTYSVTITPLKKIWFKAVNLDTNKSIQYLTSNPKTLPKGNYYIKFGHGMITINYNNQTISPNTKKIVRIVLKNGKYEYVKKSPLRNQ